MYHWLQAFEDLRWTGKPVRQIGPTHWQEWLQADAHHTAFHGFGPAPTARAINASAAGRALALHMIPLANVPLNPAPASSVRKSVTLPLVRGATETTKSPLCADKLYTSRAMMEHWHGVRCTPPPLRKTGKRRATSSKGKRNCHRG